MPELCREIRGELLRTVTRTGGHLASNLGVVELSVAMHRVFDCPRDHFIFDVGHQSYVHKMLTGRYERMQTLRQGGGISGFTKRTESEYDCFGAGHSSTSLSAALGFAQADRMMGSDAWTVAVVGDGAFTGGMIHEALNNVSPGLRLVIIINENEMSISKNIGRFAMHMARLRQKEGYFRTKRRTTHFIKKIPLIGDGLFRAIRRVKKSFKNAMYGSNYFEDMGLLSGTCRRQRLPCSGQPVAGGARYGRQRGHSPQNPEREGIPACRARSGRFSRDAARLCRSAEPRRRSAG